MHVVPPPSPRPAPTGLTCSAALERALGASPPTQDERAPRRGAGGPPGPSVHAAVQLTAAACPRCSPDVTGVGLQSASGRQSAGMSPAVTHHHHPNQPRGPGRPRPALQHRTLAAAVRGHARWHPPGSVLAPRGCIPIQRRSAPGATLSQAVGDRLGGPRRRLRGGTVARGAAWPPPVSASGSVWQPVNTLSGRRARSGDALPVPTRPGGPR